MPFNPSERDRTGEFILAGAQGLGAGIGGLTAGASRGMEKFQLQQRELQAMDEMVGMAAQSGVVDEQFLQRYSGASIGGKRALGNEALLRLSDARKMEMQNAAQERAMQQRMALESHATDENVRQFWQTREPQEPDWSEGQAGTITLPDGSVILKQPTSRNSIQLVPVAGGQNAGPAVGADPTGTGQFFWDGKQLRQVRQPSAAAQKPPDSGTMVQAQLGIGRIGEIDKELQEHAGALAKGDARYGIFNFQAREDRVKELAALRDQEAAKLRAMGFEPDGSRIQGAGDGGNGQGSGMPVGSSVGTGTRPAGVKGPRPAAPASGGAAGGQMTKAEYDALPSGATFTWNGKTYRKP